MLVKNSTAHYVKVVLNNSFGNVLIAVGGKAQMHCRFIVKLSTRWLSTKYYILQKEMKSHGSILVKLKLNFSTVKFSR